MATSNTLFRKLPSVDELLRHKSLAELAEREGLAAVTDAARAVLATMRDEITKGSLDERGVDVALSGIEEAVTRELRRATTYSLRPVINATGVILHTNMGRAPLAEAAIQRIGEVARTYSNLEFDIDSGERGKRDVHVQRLLAKLLNDAGSQFDVHSVVVNNCAAAVMLVLNSLAEGGEVIVSRGELVEIGGSFRVPDVMAKSGAILREVGTTNRTRVEDYERAINDKTKLILRVHRSNFAIVGFTEQPNIEELVALSKRKNIPVVEDLGNGSLLDLRTVGVNNESGVPESIRAGVDVITYSGDKLLGGPQAGIVSGRKELIAKIRSNPLFRALRVDKLTYAALEATLLEYVRGNLDSMPVVRMMRISADEIKSRSEALLKNFSASKKLKAEVIRGESLIGGGTTPAATLPTYIIAVTHALLSADELQDQLRETEACIVTRVEEGRVLIDLRTVFPEQDQVVSGALQSL